MQETQSDGISHTISLVLHTINLYFDELRTNPVVMRILHAVSASSELLRHGTPNYS